MNASKFKGGYAGSILYVDLKRKKSSVKPLKKAIVKRFLGGRGINAKILYDEVFPKIDPLNPENVVIFGTGPLTGLWISCGRLHITTKSPLTGTIGDGNSGGHWAPELKFAGYDFLVVLGRAEEPHYIWINDDSVEIRKAADIWGKDVWETTELIHERFHDDDIKVAAIGQAGENLVRYAAVVNDFSRVVGRSGAGAVMGSKNLKAVAVRGSKNIAIARPERFEDLLQEMTDKVKKNKPDFENYSRYGTLSLIEAANEGGWAVYRNMQSTHCPEAEKLSGEYFVRNGYAVRSMGCYGCFLGCSRFNIVRQGPFRGTYCEGVEFGTANEVTACGIAETETAIKFNELCNRYGLDTFDTGHSIAFAMECYEKGLINRQDTHGVELKFGNSEAFIRMTGDIAHRESLGNILAEGLVRASRIIGKGSGRFANHIKGMALDTDHRGLMAWGLGYVVSTRGADHLRGSASFVLSGRGMTPEEAEKLIGRRDALERENYEGAAWAVFYEECGDAVQDSLGICKFISGPHGGSRLLFYQDYEILMDRVAGLRFSSKEFPTIGERIVNLERLFNAREGFTRKDDDVPPRMREKVPDGPFKGSYVSQEILDRTLNEYYRRHGWDIKTGNPTKNKLKELGLEYDQPLVC